MAITLFLLALAVSLDSFGVGTAYGFRKMRIPLKSVVVIACCSGIVMFISMNIGVGLATLLSAEVANAVGAVILIGIGAWALYSSQDVKGEHTGQGTMKSRSARMPTADSDAMTEPVLKIEIKRLGLVIQVLKKPLIADMDRSGTISTGEAVLLGCALSLDALGAGLGAAMIGLSVWVAPPAIAIAGATLLLVGLHVGFRFQEVSWLKRLHYVPGVLLIIMGLTRFWW